MGEAVDRLVALARVKGYVRHQAGKLVRVKPYENSRHFLVTKDTEGTPLYEPHVVRNYPKDYTEKFPKFKEGVRQLGEHQPLRETRGAGRHMGHDEQNYADTEPLPGKAMRKVLAKHAKSKGSVYDQKGPGRPTDAPDNWGAPKRSSRRPQSLDEWEALYQQNPRGRKPQSLDEWEALYRESQSKPRLATGPGVINRSSRDSGKFWEGLPKGKGQPYESPVRDYIMKNGLLAPGASDDTEPLIAGHSIDWHAKQVGLPVEDFNAILVKMMAEMKRDKGRSK